MFARCLLGLWLAAAVAAQDEVLVVEKREDQRARDRATALLKRTRVDFTIEAITAKELCRQLSAMTGDKLTFLFAGKGDAATTPAFDLALGKTTPWSVMAATQARTGLRFVWRDGVVFLVGKDEVRPLTYLVAYNLRSQFVRLKNFPGPKLGLGEDGGEVLFPPEEDSGTTVSGFTAELVERLIKQNVTPDAWADAATIDDQNGLLLIRHTAAGHRAIGELLDQLGLMPLPRLVVRPAPLPASVCAPRPPRR
ncbi:MAG: hypothetical protein IPK26_19190 [Planctomycetes bacterium]|nr:hypothetical protein [Planctomycetota bacterium]